MQWNLNVQREFAGLTATVGYVGSHGVHQAFRADDANVVIPTPTSIGYLYPAGGGNVIDSANPNVGAIRLLDWAGSSSYNALQIGVFKRMSHGLQVQGSYTWGKSFDNNSGVIAGDTFGNGIGSLPWFDLHLTRALSDYNVGRTIVINANWQIPADQLTPQRWVGRPMVGSLARFLRPTTAHHSVPRLGRTAILWALAARIRGPFQATAALLAAPPWSTRKIPQLHQDPMLRDSHGASFVCGTVQRAPGAASPAPSGRVYCINLRGTAGRNDVPGPGLANLDFSVFKNNYIRKISESFNVQFRAEIFNILNRNNFALPVSPDNTDIFDSTGAPLNPPDNGAAGALTKTTTDAREVQFALKVIW